MNFFKPLHEDEKPNKFAEIEGQNERDHFSYDPEEEEKYKLEREIVAQAGDGEFNDGLFQTAA